MNMEEKKKETFLRNIHFVSNYPHTSIILKRKRLCAFPDLHVGLCSWSTRTQSTHLLWKEFAIYWRYKYMLFNEQSDKIKSLNVGVHGFNFKLVLYY